MANRVATFNTFAGLAPPWSLPNLDANFSAITSALNDPSLGYLNGVLLDSGSANNYIVTPAIGTAVQYSEGMTVYFVPANRNTAASTLTVSPLAAQPLLTPGGFQLINGEVIAGRVMGAIYHLAAGFYLIPPIGLTYVATNPGNVTLNCKGYSKIAVYINFTAATSTQIQFQNLDALTTVQVTFYNGYTTTIPYAICAAIGVTPLNYVIDAVFPTSTSGAPLVNLQSGTTVNVQNLGISNLITYVGVTNPAGSLFLAA